MTDFNAINKTPGVYVQEIDRPGPIAGVGTSTAGIIGPAAKGPIGAPTFLTNETQFTNAFGGYISSPPVYTAHAVHGFFGNGGATLYFVRVGTAVSSHLDLNDRSGGAGKPAIVATAKPEGAVGDGIQVEVKEAHLAETKVLKKKVNLAGAGASGKTAVVDDASGFAAGDVVLLDDGGGTTEKATVARPDTVAKTLTFAGNLTHTFASGTLRIADLAVGQTRLRIDLPALDIRKKIFPGSYIAIADASNSEEGVVFSVEPTQGVLTLAKPLQKSYPLGGAGDVTVKTLEFQVIVHDPNGPAADAPVLAMDPRHPSYFLKAFNSDLVQLAPADNPPNTTTPPANRPRDLAATNLAGGVDDDLSAITAAHYTNALTALEKVDAVNILLAPDRTDQAVQKALIDHCEKMQERFAVLDPQANADPAAVTAQRNALASDRGFAALYYPRLVIPDPLADGFLVIPPSGHIAGLYARVDDQKGVHKAPANETLRGLVGLERVLSDDENGPLNEIGVNVIRSFLGRGIRVWGARTIAPAAQTQWRYINVRRLMLFVEESLQEGTENAVFEPNNEALWETLKRTINGFLTRVWRSGALVGTTAEEAFRVRIDRELNPPELRALGQLVIEVRVAPTTPAEFIVFRIIQQPGEPIIEE